MYNKINTKTKAGNPNQFRKTSLLKTLKCMKCKFELIISGDKSFLLKPIISYENKNKIKAKNN